LAHKPLAITNGEKGLLTRKKKKEREGSLSRAVSARPYLFKVSENAEGKERGHQRKYYTLEKKTILWKRGELCTAMHRGPTQPRGHTSWGENASAATKGKS